MVGEQLYCVLDYETRSAADLKKTGSYEYSVHPSTSLLCVAWKLGTKKTLLEAKTRMYSPFFPGENSDTDLFQILSNPDIMLVAHNALFEQVITKHVLKVTGIPPSRWICTAAHASAMALPRALENACRVLKLPAQKDVEGKKLLLKYCKPRKATRDSSAKWHENHDDIKRIMYYCAADVEAEAQLFLKLPRLNPVERKIWELDQKINLRGFRVDRKLVTTVQAMIERETERLATETLDATGLLSTNQRDEMLKWFRAEGVPLPDLRSKTVSDTLLTSGLN